MDMRRKIRKEKNLIKIADFIILTALIFEFVFPQMSLAYHYDIKDREDMRYTKDFKDFEDIKDIKDIRDIKGIISEEAQSIIFTKEYIDEKKSIEELSKKEAIKPEIIKVNYSKYIIVTAYSSTVDQCDSTPFITANGTRVYDGIIAANFLRFGTKIRFPEYSGDKIYTVEDRMHKRFSNRADIWMKTRTQALQFGKRRIKIEVLE